MPAVDYATLDDARRQSSLTSSDHDDRLGEVLTSVSRWVDEWCQRHFWQDGTLAEPVTRQFRACSSRKLRLGPFNDLAGLVSINGSTDLSDYTLLPLNRVHPFSEPATAIEGSFTPGEIVEISGVWGWPEIPDQVREATLIQTARILKRKDSAEGVVGMDQFGMVRVSGRPDPDVEHLLVNLRHPHVVLVA